MKTYEIKFEPVVVDDVTYPKYNIYYYINNVLEIKLFHSIDGINGEIKDGYVLKENK